MKLPFLTPCVFQSTANSARSSAIFVAITALFFVAAINDARAQFTFASDLASNYGGAGEPTFASGQNGGFGFNAWSFTQGGNSGTFIGNPGITGMSSESFGLYANPTNGGNFIDVNRNLSTAMQVGDTFSFQWGANWDSGGPGNTGFNIYVGGSQLINVNMGGSSTITINGTNTGFSFGTTAMNWTFFYSDATTLVVTANDRDGSGTYSNNFTVSGGVDAFRWYASQLVAGDAQRQPYYNNLLVTNSGLYNVATTQTESRFLGGSGNLAKTGNGTLTISGATNSFSGTVGITNGAIRATTSSALGLASAVTVQSGAALEYTSGINSARNMTINGTGISAGGALRNVSGVNTNSGTITLGSASRINADSGTLTLDVASGNAVTGTFGVTFGGNGNIVANDNIDVSSASITKDGVGTLTVAGSQNATGGITVSGGTLVYNASNSGSGSVTVGNGGKLGGSGTLGAVTIQSGGTIAPGNSPGNLSVSSLTLDGGGFYDWELTDTTGVAGTGWDVITVGAGSGTITLNATSGNEFTINVIGTNPTNWASNTSRTWDIIDGGGWSPSFSTSAFTINTAGFTASGTLGSWGVENNGGNLRLVYTAPAAIYELTVASGSQTQSEATGGFALLEGAGATVTKLGAGTLVMTNTQNSYTGTTTVKNGTLQINTAVSSSVNTVLGNSSGAIIIGDTAAANAASFNFGAAVQNDRALSIVAGTGTAARTVGTTISSGTAIQAGNVAMSTNATYSAASGGTLRVSGAISGAGNATISEAGTIVFSGNNSYSGTTTVSSGSTLVASNNNALGNTTGNTTVSSGGVLAMAGGISSAENISISGTGISSGGALRNINGANTNTGTITVAANATISADTSTTLQLNSVNISGAANRNVTFAGVGNTLLTGGVSTFGADLTNRIIKSGAGNLIISNSGTTGNGQVRIGEGSVIVAAGSLTASTNTGVRAIDLGLSGEATGVATANNVSLLARSGVTVSNSVYVAPNEASATRTMGTDSSAGTATFNNQIYLGGNLRLTSAGTANAVFSGNITNDGTHSLTKVGAGTVTLSGTNTYGGTAVVEEGTLALSGGSALANTVGVAVNGGTLAVNTTETIAALSGSGGSVALNAGLVTSFDTASSSYSGVFTGSSSLSKNGTGTLTLAGNSTGYTGEVILNEGGLLAGNAGAFGTGTVTINFDDGTGTRSLASSSSTGYTLNNNFNLYYNAFTLGQTTGGTGSLTLGGTGKTFFLGEDGTENVRVITVNGSHAIGAQVTGGANNRLAVAGGGTLTLSGANTFSGGSQLREGTILVGNNAALGTGTLQIQFDQTGTRTLASSSSASYTLANNVNIFNTMTLGQTTGGTGSLTLSGTVSLGDPVGEVNSRTVTVNGAHTMSGVIGGGNGLVKAGGGTLTLSGNSANTYTGATTVSAGTLELNKATGNAIVGNVTVNSGAVLLLSGSNQVDSGATDVVTLSGGTIQRASGVSEVFGDLNLTAGSFLDFSGGTGGTITFTGLDYTPSALLSLQLMNFTQGNTLVFQNTTNMSSLIGSGFTFSGSGGFGSTSFSGSTFTITAIPEPSTYLAAAGLLAMFLWPARRRLIKDAKSILGLRPNGRDRIEAYRNA